MNRSAKVFLVAGLLAVVGMAFRVSWNALRDVAHSIGADHTAATVYPLVVDGLMALALVAALFLPEGRDRRFALRVLGSYTAASLVLNYVHGLVPAIAAGGRVRLADWSPANWALVLLATSLPVGSIFFGSDLVAKVLHHKPELTQTDQTMMNRSPVELREPLDREPETSVYVEPTPATTTPTQPLVAAPTTRPRRSTGKVPPAARSARPKRTDAELLDEARSATADWPDEKLTAAGIRKQVRVAQERARELRDQLKAERAQAVTVVDELLTEVA